MRSYVWPFIYSFYVHQDYQTTSAIQPSRFIIIYPSLVSSPSTKTLFGNQFKFLHGGLGVVLYTIDGSLQATDERIVKLSSDLGSLLVLSSQHSVCKIHVKSVTSITGQIISLSPCVGSFTRIMTRHLFSAVDSVFFLGWRDLLSDDSISEITFWDNNVDSLNVEFIREYNRYRSELVSLMLPIQSLVRLSSPTLGWFVCLLFSSELVS